MGAAVIVVNSTDGALSRAWHGNKERHTVWLDHDVVFDSAEEREAQMFAAQLAATIRQQIKYAVNCGAKGGPL